MENHIINCSKHLPRSQREVHPLPLVPERYYEAKMVCMYEVLWWLHMRVVGNRYTCPETSEGAW